MRTDILDANFDLSVTPDWGNIDVADEATQKVELARLGKILVQVIQDMGRLIPLSRDVVVEKVFDLMAREASYLNKSHNF